MNTDRHGVSRAETKLSWIFWCLRVFVVNSVKHNSPQTRRCGHLQEATFSQPSGTSQGVGKSRHSPVSGFRAGVTTWMHTAPGGVPIPTSTKSPSGKTTLTAPAPTGLLPVIRSEPVKSGGAPGTRPGRKLHARG